MGGQIECSGNCKVNSSQSLFKVMEEMLLSDDIGSSQHIREVLDIPNNSYTLPVWAPHIRGGS